LTKTADQPTYTAAGQIIGYTYVVTNNDQFSSIINISVSDDTIASVTCDSTTLGPGASTNCTGDYTTTAADVSAGSVTNTASASGTFCPDGCIFPVESPEVSETIFFEAQPSLSVSKSAEPATYDEAGDVIAYSYVVTNTGNVPLTGISVDDDRTAAPSCLASTLAPGAFTTCTASYVITAADVSAGSVTNTAVASGDSCGEGCIIQSPPDSATVTFQPRPSLTLSKSANPTTYDSAGDAIAYSYVVTNNGNVALSSISISDDKVAPVSCPAVALAPSASLTCTGSYTTTAADVTAGSVTNTATAAGSCGEGCGATSEPAQATITFAEAPALTLSKSANPTTYDAAGDPIAYSYLVANTGNVALSSISITDDRVAAVSCPAVALAPGASLTCTGNYSTTAADVAAGTVTNTATAAGSCGEGCSATSAPAQATITFERQPSLTLSKSADPTTFGGAGEAIAYSYLVTNNGNVALSSISISDDKVAPVSCPAGALAPGASLTCTGGYTTSAADVADGSVTNTATAAGSCGEGCSATSGPAQATITLRAPSAGSITIVKRASGGGENDDDDGDDDDDSDDGESFSFTATNLEPSSFSLAPSGGSASRVFADLPPGTYSVTEVDLPRNWELTELSCRGEAGGTPTIVNLADRSVSIGLDGGEAIVCTFTNTFDFEAHISQTQNIIHSFLRHRIDRLVNEEPDRSRIFRRIPGVLWGDAGAVGGGGAATPFMALSGSTSDSSAQMTIATSLLQMSQAYAAVADAGPQLAVPAFDVWIEAHFSQYEDDAGDLDGEGHFGILYLGADYLVTPSVLVGALVQLDWTEEASGEDDSSVEGFGWMVGPYLSARITPHLFFDTRAAWGTSDNTVDPFGEYEDDFSTDRWLASARLTGNWNMGNLRITPSVGVTYVEERQEDYTDSLGVLIPEQTVSLGRLAFGPELAYRMLGRDGLVFEPQLSVTGMWDFDNPDVEEVGGLVSAEDDWRAKLQAGFSVRARGGAAVRVSGTYDGIGSSDFSSLGGQIWVNVPLR
jgi:hypothetical protein